MNFIRRLIDKARPNTEAPRSHGNRWHTYERPGNGDRLRVYNASEREMPLEMNVNGFIYAHVAPFDGEPNDKKELDAGDYVYRPLLQAERKQLVEHRLKEAKKWARRQNYALRSDHELRHKFHAELSKECGVFQIQE